ncbi:MAG: glycosyltransferase [Bacteroidetes bacterium]|nr:glycosyltransferase [Bacteroidota bacterium]
MHVLVIPSWYKNPENPMVGTFFEEQARGLMKKGCKVGIFHVGFKSFSYKGPLLKEKYIDNSLLTYYFNYKGRVPKLSRLNYWSISRKAYKDFKNYVKENGKPDIIHAHSVFWGGIIARYISKKTAIPYVMTEHLTNFISGGITEKADLYFARQVFNQSAINIAVSTTFKKDLCDKLEIDKNKFVVINNMVAPIFFDDFKEKKINSNEGMIFFTNSFIDERKNHKMLIEAFADFLKSYPDSKLMIGGNPIGKENEILKKSLIKLCKDLKIEDNVIFLGSTTRQEVKTQLTNCHVFLLTSKFETFGVVLIEALAAGRPVISTNSKGPTDIITKQNGLLINSWQPTHFAEGMKNLIAAYNSYSQVEISSDCRTRFGEDHIVGQIINIYSKVLDQKNCNKVGREFIIG